MANTHDNVDLNREYIRTSEAAKRAKLSMPYLTQLLREHTIEGFQLGREWFIYTDSLDTFLATPRKSGPKGPRKKNLEQTQETMPKQENSPN